MWVKTIAKATFFFLCIFFIPFIILALLSPSVPVAPQIRRHIVGRRSSPLPITVHAFISIARRIQHFLPSSTRVELPLNTVSIVGAY